jgi:transposase
METLFERVAGLDVHKDTVVACVRVIVGREVSEELVEWGTTTNELLGLRDWLEGRRVELIGMEATGVYWKPIVRHEALLNREGMKGPLQRTVAAVR